MTMGRPKKRKITHSKRHPMTKAEIRRRFQVANMVDAQFKEWAVTDVMSIFLATLHHLPKDAFGIVRLERLYDKMKELDSDIAAGYGNIRQPEETLKLETGMELDRETATERIKVKGRHDKITYATQNYLSTLYMWVLHDTFGWGKKRIFRTYRACAEMANRLNAGAEKMSNIEQDLKAIGWEYPADKWEIATT